MRLWDRNGPRARVPFFCRCPGICRRGFPPEIPAAAPSPGPSRAPLPRHPHWPPGAPARLTGDRVSSLGPWRAGPGPPTLAADRPAFPGVPPIRGTLLAPGVPSAQTLSPAVSRAERPAPTTCAVSRSPSAGEGRRSPRLRGPRPCRPRPAATAGSRSSTPGRALVTCRHPASRREEARPRDRRPALRARRSSQRPRATHAASPASPPSSAERVTETWASVRSCSSRPPRPSLLLRSAR